MFSDFRLLMFSNVRQFKCFKSFEELKAIHNHLSKFITLIHALHFLYVYC